MKKSLVVFTILMLGLGANAYAEAIEGKITSLNKDNNSLTIAPRGDQAANLPNKVDLSLKAKADLKGIASLEDLSVGDEVKVEAERTDENHFQVNKLERASADDIRKDQEKADKDAFARERDAKGEKRGFFDRNRDADVDADARAKNAADIDEDRNYADDADRYHWNDKLKRGALNIVSSPVEIARSIYVGTRNESLAYGWTVGLIRGVGQGVLRLGSGVVDLVTFPFNFPTRNKEPMLNPEYVWDKPGVKYINDDDKAGQNKMNDDAMQNADDAGARDHGDNKGLFDRNKDADRDNEDIR
jgi:putative exosortase-associated protein (TIGR04073 family)